MSELSNKGLLAGLVFWVAIGVVASSQFSCLSHVACGQTDLFLAGVLGVGFIAPSWFVALLCSS